MENSTRRSEKSTTRISYEVDLFSTSESDKEARSESDKELVIKKRKAAVKCTKKDTSNHDDSPEEIDTPSTTKQVNKKVHRRAPPATIKD